MYPVVGHQVVTQYKRLVHKVLADHQIYPTHVLYDDFLQELLCYLYELGITYASLSAFEQEYPLAYLYRKLKWKLIDLRRKEYREQHEEVSLNEWDTPVEMEEFATLEVRESLQSFYERLSVKDQEKIHVLLTDQTLSRQLRSYYRKQLRKKLTEFSILF